MKSWEVSSGRHGARLRGGLGQFPCTSPFLVVIWKKKEIFSMNVDFSEIFTYSNITFAIAILGALLSVYNFTKDIVQNRFKIHIAFREYYRSGGIPRTKRFVFFMNIENCSRTALSISRMQLKRESKVYDFSGVSQRVYSKKEHSPDTFTSVSFPQYIPDMGVIGSHFVVETDADIPNDLSDWELIIMTNRGKKRYKISKLISSK